jgi:hypothetical protein
MPGPRPKPLSLQIVEGDPRKRGKRKLAQAAKMQRKGIPILPPAPANLTAEEQSQYETLAAAVDLLGLTDSSDSEVVALAAIACVQAREVKSGSALRTALAYLTSLGCGGPASRMRMPPEKGDQTQDLMAILSAPRAPKEKVQ